MDQKLEVNVDLFKALTSVLGAAPTEATPVVVLSAYLHSLAKDYGLSDSQSLSGDHLNRVRPPLDIAPWLTELLGGELEPEFLRDRVYRAFVELAQDSDARRLINRREPLTETGVLKLAQVHWNIERTETRPLLPVRSAQAIAGKLARVADIKANAREDFATMRLSPRSKIGVTGLGDGQAFQSSGQGFRTLGARIAVLAARDIAASARPQPTGELRVTTPASGQPAAVIWWGEPVVRVAAAPAFDLSLSILPQLDALFLAGAWNDARPLNDFMIGHFEEQSIADFGAADRDLAREYLRRSMMFRGRGEIDQAKKAGDTAYELFRALVDLEGDDPDPDLLTEFILAAGMKLIWKDSGQLLERLSLWKELLELGEGLSIAEQPNGFMMLLTAADVAVAVGKDVEQQAGPSDPDLRSRVALGEIDLLREEVDEFLDRVHEIFDRVPASGDLIQFRNSFTELSRQVDAAFIDEIVTDIVTDRAQREHDVAVAILLVSVGEVQYARTADLDGYLDVMRGAVAEADRLKRFFRGVPDYLVMILRNMRGRLAMLLTESGRSDEAVEVLMQGVHVLRSQDTLDASDVKDLVDYAAVALMSERADLVLAWTDLVAERRDEDADSDASNHFAPCAAHVLACGALLRLERIPEGVARLTLGVDLQARLAEEIPPMERRFIPAPITSSLLREIAESLGEHEDASKSVLRLAERVDP